ncbi:MAG: hypothetical protein IKI23_00640, partial [Lachnospiraceae bacterium]|nr:hypothetical protein [Lachnospiraceae bacterium]
MKTFHKIEKKILKFIILFGHILEIVLAVLIMIGLIISLKPLFLQIGHLGDGIEEALPHFLEAAFNLVIGIEFVVLERRSLRILHNRPDFGLLGLDTGED